MEYNEAKILLTSSSIIIEHWFRRVANELKAYAAKKRHVYNIIKKKEKKNENDNDYKKYGSVFTEIYEAE